MVATKPRVRASTGVARELGASAMHRWEDYVACGAPQRARRSAMGGLSPQTFQGYDLRSMWGGDYLSHDGNPRAFNSSPKEWLSGISESCCGTQTHLSAIDKIC